MVRVRLIAGRGGTQECLPHETDTTREAFAPCTVRKVLSFTATSHVAAKAIGGRGANIDLTASAIEYVN
ncbi:hypothetical protein GCM10023219_17880 [Stakelama sediminis]|uniref:Uncharacterized protein n=1 Tax=Stakelama sediminis TaxID=463200 RepID=A0A840Z257_9SPHN|nr:hypothetical protein [Stakelama sediminis]